MLLSEIKAVQTLGCVYRYNINLEEFENIEQLRKYIRRKSSEYYNKRNKDYKKEYYKKNKEKFLSDEKKQYMKDYYRKNKELKSKSTCDLS